MLQSHHLREIVVIQHERRSQRRIQDLDLARQHLDFAGRNVGVDRAFRPRAHLAGHFQHKLVAYRFGDAESFRRIRINDDLCHAFTVAQIDENDAAVVTTTMRPATERHGLAYQVAVQMTAVMGTHMQISYGEKLINSVRFERN